MQSLLEKHPKLDLALAQKIKDKFPTADPEGIALTIEYVERVKAKGKDLAFFDKMISGAQKGGNADEIRGAAISKFCFTKITEEAAAPFQKHAADVKKPSETAPKEAKPQEAPKKEPAAKEEAKEKPVEKEWVPSEEILEGMKDAEEGCEVYETNYATNSEMVSHLVEDGEASEPVAAAMLSVDRKLFVPSAFAASAYHDHPLPLNETRRIPQPALTARMCEATCVKEGMTVLEVGTGCGYQTAVLAALVGKKGKVVSIELTPEIAEAAKKKLAQLKIKNVEIIVGDASLGHKAGAPYDAIIVPAVAPSIPRPLSEQLKEGGKMVIPLGPQNSKQKLTLVEKQGGKVSEKRLADVMFVPLIGKYGFEKEEKQPVKKEAPKKEQEAEEEEAEGGEEAEEEESPKQKPEAKLEEEEGEEEDLEPSEKEAPKEKPEAKEEEKPAEDEEDEDPDEK